MKTDREEKNITRYIWGAAPWLFVCVLLTLAIMWGIKISKERKRIKEEKITAYKENRPPVNVVVLEVEPTEIIEQINLPATIASWEDLTVFAEVSGLIISISAVEGDSVKKGQELAKIDPRDYQNRLKQVQTAYNLAYLDYERISKLATTNSVSQAQFDSAKARLDEASSALSSAKLDLERCVIIAPVSGFINKRFAQEGLLVNRSDPLFQILDTRQVKVEVGIPESDVYAISNLNEAKITVEALNNLEVTGKKVFLSRQPESFARVYNLKLRVDNPDNILRPGMFARVNLIKAIYPDSLVVPIYSIITNGVKNYLYVANDDIAHYREINLGILDGWRVQITGDIKPQDKVIVVGHRNLEDGQMIKIIQTITDPESLYK